MSNPTLTPSVKTEVDAIGTLSLNGREVSFYPGESLLETARREGIDIPSFCYHSELSVYGACRLCLVELEGRGLVASCSMKPESGMVIRTDSRRLRRLRRTILELLLSNHKLDCVTCVKGSSCRLHELCQRLNIREMRLGERKEILPLDESIVSLVRDPNKCILCGDCVRMCSEIQGVGVLDFAYRGSKTVVAPAFNHSLVEVDCVYCGQCAAICPTAAISIRSELDTVWDAIEDADTMVVAQLAPAVRVALGEEFGLPPGEDGTGLLVAALKRAGFDKVYDTVFSADLTTIEETHEFKERLEKGGPFPHLTSCCPAWVKYCEQYFPDYIKNISTCKSPQQMLGSLAKQVQAPLLKLKPEQLKVVSIMPCTAKKFEANRPEHMTDGVRDVDAVLSTVEVAQLLREANIIFSELKPEAADNPLGMATGAGVIFGYSGGVSEAVLRLVMDDAGLPQPTELKFRPLEGNEKAQEIDVTLGDVTLKLAVVSSLKAAGDLMRDVRAGRRDYHLIEVMACPGGCVGGGGQPAATSRIHACRKEGLDDIDRSMQLRVASHNPFVQSLYQEHLKTPGSKLAHTLLHTTYSSRRRMPESSSHPIIAARDEVLEVSVCVGTSCYLKGSHAVLETLLNGVKEAGWEKQISVSATFCLEQCDRGVSVKVGDEVLTEVTPETAKDILKNLIRPRVSEK